MELQIIYEDDHILAINKPAGLLVHRTRIAEEKKMFAMQMLRDQVGYRVYPLHRLDRPTSGVLLFGKNSHTASLLGPYFTNHQFYKEYWAIVRGYTADHEIINYPLINKEKKVLQDAVTEYMTLAKIELAIPVGPYQTARYSLVKVIPQSGRFHQIRKHFGHIRHYIIGDKSHGDWRHNKMFFDNYQCQNLCLHARSLQFTHPVVGSFISIEAAFPQHFHKISQEFNWSHFLHANS
jgi:tRNA pseudouridine65 synthase